MSSSVAISSPPPSRVQARGMTAGADACDESSSDEEMPGAANMWCPLLCAAYHYTIGECLAEDMCSRSVADLS